MDLYIYMLRETLQQEEVRGTASQQLAEKVNPY